MMGRTDTSAAAYAGIAPVAEHLRAIVHRVLCEHPAGLSDATDGGVEVSAASLQMALAYMAHLEAVAKGGVA